MIKKYKISINFIHCNFINGEKSMKKVIKILAPTLTFIVFAVTINWGYVGYVSKMLLQAAGEVARGEGTTSQQLLVELRDMQARDVFNMEVIGRMPFVDTDDDPEDDGESIPIRIITEDFPDVPSGKIQNTGKTSAGKDLSGDLVDLNNVFKGSNYEEKDSYNATVASDLRERYVYANIRCTAWYNENLSGEYDDNSEFEQYLTDDEKADLQALKKLRKKADVLTKDTIMQKVMVKSSADDIISKGYRTVRGCVTRAQDAAPFVYNVFSAYVHLRLDFEGNPYQKLISDEGDVYILRYKSSKPIGRTNFPKLGIGSYKPPCTETGYVGSPKFLIPEYHSDDRQIKSGVIYRLDYEGKEWLYAYFDGAKFVYADGEE